MGRGSWSVGTKEVEYWSNGEKRFKVQRLEHIKAATTQQLRTHNGEPGTLNLNHYKFAELQDRN